MHSLHLSALTRTLLPFTMIFAASYSALAQGTQADYDRSAALGKRFDNKVFRQSVSPHWIDNDQKFWYRIDTAPGQYEFVLVDAVAGKRQLAFDHQKLAKALATETKTPVSSTALPFTWIDVAPDGSWVRFRAGKQVWQYNQDGTLKPSTQPISEERLAPIRRSRPSDNGGDPTAITFINRTQTPITLYWIDTDGNPVKYETIAAGDINRRTTFAGHVWQVEDAQGKVLGIYRATGDETQAIIGDDGTDDAKPKTEPKEPPPPKIEAAPAPEPLARAYVRNFNLWMRTKDGKETQLSTNGTADNFYSGDLHPSPNGRYVVAYQIVPAQEHPVTLVESSPKDQEQPRVKVINYLKAGDRVEQDRVRLFDFQTGKEVTTSDALFSNQWSLEDMGWSEDGQNYRFLFNQRGHQHLRVLSMNLDGTVRPIVDEESKTFIDYSQKTYMHEVPGKSELIWASERDGWNHLYLYDTKTGQVKNQITKGNWVMRSVEDVDDAKRQIWFRAFGIVPGQDPYYAQLARINFDGTGLQVLTEGDGTHTWKWSPDRKYLLDTYSRVDLAPVTTLHDGTTGKLICNLESADMKPLLDSGWPLTERFSAMGRDGQTPVYGVIIKPTNFNPTKKYPVIENIYAGPQDFFTPKSFSTQMGMHQLAELGFIVVQLDGMGTNWRSKAFHDTCWKNLKDAGFPDRIAWMKAAQTTRPWMDLTRVGIYGGSAGGQNAMGALLFHPEFYKVAIADSGCHDNRMDKIWWNEAWMGWPVDKSYEDSSNVVHAGNLQGDLMLIYGELDTNVDPSSTVQVVNALIKAGKDFDLMIVPGGGHCPGGSEYGLRRQRDFFVKHLLGVQPPPRNSA